MKFWRSLDESVIRALEAEEAEDVYDGPEPVDDDPDDIDHDSMATPSLCIQKEDLEDELEAYHHQARSADFAMDSH